jgi:hypothetical protein
VEGVSLRWLLGFMVDLYDQLPDDFFFKIKAFAEEFIIYTFESEIDEMQSFNGKPTNSGYRLLSTSTVGKLSHSTSATGVVRVPKPFGSQYPRATESMLCSIQMAGVPMRESFHKSNIESSKSKSG